jgi:hypothetical protein
MSVASREESAQKAFTAQDKRWGAPRFFVAGLVTLAICLSTIYMMSTVTGCSLQIVP